MINYMINAKENLTHVQRIDVLDDVQRDIYGVALTLEMLETAAARETIEPEQLSVISGVLVFASSAIESVKDSARADERSKASRIGALVGLVEQARGVDDSGLAELLGVSDEKLAAYLADGFEAWDTKTAFKLVELAQTVGKDSVIKWLAGE